MFLLGLLALSFRCCTVARRETDVLGGIRLQEFTYFRLMFCSVWVCVATDLLTGLIREMVL